MNDVFHKDDTSEAVRRLQDALRTLSRSDPNIPAVYIDGIYGAETSEAVASVQKIGDLAVTGELDRRTNDLIYGMRDDISARQTVNGYRPKFDNYEGNKLTPGDDFDDIYLLQLLLRELSVKDERFFVNASGRFDTETEKAVRLLQSVLGMPENGSVTVSEWNALVALTERTEGYI